jgi:hypothetical protein
MLCLLNPSDESFSMNQINAAFGFAPVISVRMLCLLNPSDESFSMNQINPVMCLYSEMRLGLVWFCFSENRLFEKQDFLISRCPENMGVFSNTDYRAAAAGSAGPEICGEGGGGRRASSGGGGVRLGKAQSRLVLLFNHAV